VAQRPDGPRAFSKTATARPWEAKTFAQDKPANPAPMTATGASEVVV
jgi:hypothetical protein